MFLLLTILSVHIFLASNDKSFRTDPLLKWLIAIFIPIHGIPTIAELVVFLVQLPGKKILAIPAMRN